MTRPVTAIAWLGGRVRLIDQTLLPATVSTIETDDPAVIAEAIRTLRLRGAPLIGVAAAYGTALAAVPRAAEEWGAYRDRVLAAIDMLAAGLIQHDGKRDRRAWRWQAGIVHAGVGKASFSAEKLAENIRAFVDSVSKAKPQGSKGTYMERMAISSSMGPGVKVDISSVTGA